MGVHGIWFDENGDIYLDPEFEAELEELEATFGELLDKYSDAAVIIAIADIVYDFLDKDKAKALRGAVLGLEDVIRGFVKDHWGKDPEVFVTYTYSLFPGLKLFIAIFGVPSLVRKEELTKFLETEGVRPTRQLKKRTDELEATVTRMLLSKWLTERLREAGCKVALASFEEKGITDIEVYSLKEKKWAGKRPKDFDVGDGVDEVAAYLAARALSPI